MSASQSMEQVQETQGVREAEDFLQSIVNLRYPEWDLAIMERITKLKGPEDASTLGQIARLESELDEASQSWEEAQLAAETHVDPD